MDAKQNNRETIVPVFPASEWESSCAFPDFKQKCIYKRTYTTQDPSQKIYIEINQHGSPEVWKYDITARFPAYLKLTSFALYFIQVRPMSLLGCTGDVCSAQADDVGGAARAFQGGVGSIHATDASGHRLEILFARFDASQRLKTLMGQMGTPPASKLSPPPLNDSSKVPSSGPHSFAPLPPVTAFIKPDAQPFIEPTLWDELDMNETYKMAHIDILPFLGMRLHKDEPLIGGGDRACPAKLDSNSEDREVCSNWVLTACRNRRSGELGWPRECAQLANIIAQATVLGMVAAHRYHGASVPPRTKIYGTYAGETCSDPNVLIEQGINGPDRISSPKLDASNSEPSYFKINGDKVIVVHKFGEVLGLLEYDPNAETLMDIGSYATSLTEDAHFNWDYHLLRKCK